MTDPKGQVYSFAYNALGWVTQRIDPAGHADQYAYDREGQVRQFINRSGHAISYTYDALHRVLSKAGTPLTGVTWTYSADGRVITASDAILTETSYLAVSSRVDSTRTVWADLPSLPFVVRSHYTPAGLRDTVQVAGGGIAFRSRAYRYDLTRGAVNEIHFGGATTTLTTNDDGLRTGTTFPGGDLVSRQYSTLHGEADIRPPSTYAAAAARALAFDALGRRVREVGGDGGTSSSYSYDSLSRLTAERFDHSVSPTPCDGDPPPLMDDAGNQCTTWSDWATDSTHTFSYDPVGNRTDKGGTYGTGNRIATFDACTYATDFDGNVTARTCPTETVNFTWSAENTLSSYTVGTTTVAFQYDGAGRLIRKDVNGLVQRRFLWDGDNLLAELGPAGTTKVAEYSYYGLDDPHAVVLRDSLFFAQSGGLGHVVALTDSAAGLVRTYGYDAWGQETGGSDPRAFNGADRARVKGAQRLGEEVELYYMRARWYEPRTGRFLSEDPIGLAGGINPYVYAGDDPVNRSDPLGLDDCEKNADGSYTCPAVVVESGPPQLLPLGYGNDRGAMSLGLLTTFPVSIIPPKPLGPKGPSCAEAKKMLALSLALDAGFLVSGGAAAILRAGKGVAIGIRGATAMSGVYARGNLIIAGRALRTATLGRTGIGFGVGVGAAAQGLTDPGALLTPPGLGNLLLDALPIIGSVRAYDRYREACQ